MMTDTCANPVDLRRLLAPIGIDQFFASYWQRRPLTVDLSAGDFQRIIEEIGPLDIARLASMARRGARAWIANDYVAHSAILVDASNAAKFFDAGATLYFFDVPLERLTAGLADFLGAPGHAVHASFFLTPNAGGATPHFDSYETFTIQLTGHKRWIVSESPLVESPPEGHVLDQKIPISLTGLLDETRKVSEVALELRPGTLLYVPRGTAHRTKGEGMSWSLNLSYARTMWLDLICEGLSRHLSGSARWRGTVAGVREGCDPSVGQANILPELAAELRDLFSDPAEIDRLRRAFLEARHG